MAIPAARIILITSMASHPCPTLTEELGPMSVTPFTLTGRVISFPVAAASQAVNAVKGATTRSYTGSKVKRK